MDDFEYSVHISDQDWDCFFQECEDCNLLSPGLASREDSGMSDIDEMGCLFGNRNPAVGTASTDPDPDLQIDGPPDCEGSPVCNYLSKYGIRSPEQVLSGSEEDLHLQTVNLFFEQLKSVTENQKPLDQSHVVIRGSEKTGHLEGLIDKQDVLSVDTGPSGQNRPSLRGEITKKGVANTWSDKSSVKALEITSANAQEHASKSDTELVIGRKPLAAPLITVRMKQEQPGRYNGLSKNLELTPETKPPDKEKMVVVIKKDMTDTYPARQNIAQLDAISSSDSRDSPFGQIPVSPSRRKRRKKKRMSVEPLEQGHEAQIHIHQSESEEERFIQREEISNFPANVWKTEHLSLQRIKTPSIVRNTDHLQLRNTFDLEADYKFSKSLPVSFISDLGTTLPKPEVGHISFNTISKSMHDTSLANNGQLKAKICELSLLPQTDKVLNVKENGLDITESLQCDPAVRLRESRTGIGETLSAPLSDNSDAGCQRKSLLSPSVSSTVDSTEPPSFTVSFKLTEDKDFSCLGNETDCSPIKNEQTVPSSCNIVEISATKGSSLSLTDNIDRAESCSDGKSPEIFTCSLEASQKQKACVHENISESQITKESSLYLTDSIDRAESCSDGRGPETFTCSQETSKKPKACIDENISESQITKESSLSLIDSIDRAESCWDGKGPETFTSSQEASKKQKACIHEKMSESQITKESSLYLTDNTDRAESCWDGKDRETFTSSQEASKKQIPCIHEKMSESQTTKESSLSLTDNVDRAESCSGGNSPEIFTCSLEASQKQKACIHKNISESQITKESSLYLTNNIDRAESCSDGRGPEIFTCSLEASQKQKACIHENISESQITKESSLSLIDNIDRAECCWDGKGPETFTCSQETSQKQKACIHEKISESQNHLGSQTIEINKNIPVNETDAKTESHMSDNTDHGTDEDYIQSRNKTSEVLIVNASPIETGNSDESDDTRDISDNEVAVSTSKQLFCGKLIRSSEDTHGPTEEMLSEGPTQDVSELPENMVDEIEDSSSSELKSEGKDLESVSLDASSQLPCPVFAISSFWNEMEKLTINDILRLRLISNAQHPSILTQPEDGSIVDTTDAADSGYFTQPDDSKPDRLSGDMSYISDLDEDLAQLQTPFPSKQEDELSEWASRVPSSCGVMWENDPDPVVVGDEVVHRSSETALSEHLYTANAQQCFRRMCKNMSVQNLQALDTQPIRQIMRNASMHSIHSEGDDDFMDPFYHVNTSGSKIFSDDEEEMESSGITFSEIIQFFFGEDEPERCPSRGDNVAASYLDGTGTSLPETYDHFFSEFDAIVEESGGDKIVPIFSCSRSANRNLQFPEAYDYFFPDSPGSSDEDDENDNAAVKVVTRYDYKSPNHDPVDMYEHFFSEDESDFLWTSPVSLRKVRRTGFTVPEEKTCSGELVPVKTFPKGIIQPINAMSPDGSPFPDSLLFNMENRIFQQLAEQQKNCMEMQTVVADPRLDAPFLPLKQADMCLVCIAFASWVLKSTGSGGDTWKAALLANVSALSAIRYLRRHKREEVSGKTPLRQIEPA